MSSAGKELPPSFQVLVGEAEAEQITPRAKVSVRKVSLVAHIGTRNSRPLFDES